MKRQLIVVWLKASWSCTHPMHRGSRRRRAPIRLVEALEHRLCLSDLVGYTFFGPNSAYNAQNGAIGGGYFILDPNVLPQITQGDIEAGVHEIQTYDMSSVEGAIDDSLADATPPGYVSGQYAEFLGGPQDNGGLNTGFLRYGPLGDYQNITIYTNQGPVPTAGETLGAAFASHGGVKFIAGGPVSDTSRYTVIQAPTITPFTAQDVFSNPASLYKTVEPNGITVMADFTPHVNVGGYNFPMQLSDVAALFGVDHFNWVQKVTLPQGWSAKIDDGTAAPDPLIDPIQSPVAHYVLTNSDGTSETIPTGWVPDSLPPYYNEGGGGIADVHNNTHPFDLSFLDTPGLPATLNVNLRLLQFRTELVGVSKDGTVEKDTGLGFTWYSNTVDYGFGITGGGAYLSNLDPTDLPPVVAGGISDVSVFRPPSVTAPSSASVKKNGSLVFSAANGNGIVVADGDAGNNVDELTLSAADGTLTLASTAGLTFTSGANGTGSMTVTGALADLNAALNGLVYTPTSGYSGPDSLDISFNDPNVSLPGSATISINVGFPTISAPAVVGMSKGESLRFSAAGGNGISVADDTAGDTVDTLALTDISTVGTLTLGSTAGLTFTAGANGTDSMTVTGTLADLDAALDGLVYTPAPSYSGSGTLSISISDPTDNLTSSTAIVISIGLPIIPTPSAVAPSTASVDENGSITFSSGNKNVIAVADAAAGSNIEQLTLAASVGTLTLGSTAGLTFTAGANGTGSMTVTGTLADLNAALNGLIFQPGTYFGSASLMVSINDLEDGLVASAVVTATVNEVNQPPAVAAPPTASVTENGALVFSSGNYNEIAAVDAAVGKAEQLTLTADAGTLALGSTMGLTFTAGADGTGSMTVAGTLADLDAALNGLVYTPVSGYIGPDVLKISINDPGDHLAGSASIAISVNQTQTPTAPTITWTNPAGITYGTPLSSTQLDATASVPGTFAYSPAPGTVLEAGIATLSVTFTPTDTADYETVTATTTIDVVPAPLTITALDASKVAGQPNPAFSVQYSGFVLGQGPSDLSGTLTFSTPATSASPAGSYPIILGGLSSPDYAIRFVAGTLLVTPSNWPGGGSGSTPVAVTGLQWQTLKPKHGRAVKELVIDFSGALDPGAADNLGAYVLDGARRVKKHLLVYAKPLPLVSASYNPPNHTVTLTLRGRVPKQGAQLTINADLVRDVLGQPLDGNHDGRSGGNFVATLNVRGVPSMARPMAEPRAGQVTDAAIDVLMADESPPMMIRNEHRHRYGAS